MIAKKHYKAIADIINIEYTRYDNKTYGSIAIDDREAKLAIDYIILQLANYFQEDNSCFDNNKFIKMCKVQ